MRKSDSEKYFDSTIRHSTSYTIALSTPVPMTAVLRILVKFKAAIYTNLGHLNALFIQG